LVPEIADTAYRGATIRQLIDMRTGLAAFEEAQQQTYEAAAGWAPAAPGETGGLHAFAQTLAGPAKPHGGPFAYVSMNTDLLGWAIERATGQRFSEVVSERLWRPMGAEDPAYITTDVLGAPRCTGGVCATVRDMARVGQLVLQGGLRGSRQIVPGEWIEDMAGNGDAEAWRTGEFAAAFAGMDMRYRGGWYVIDGAPQTLFAMGVHGQNIFVDRENGLVIAKASSQAMRLDYTALVLTQQAVPEIRRVLLGG
jgi:CubicO group peptidase (beta-lactamase class C family)